MKYYVYILYSQTRDLFYIGHTYHLIERLAEHNAGKTLSTKSGKPWQLVYSEEYPDKSTAYKREMAIKNMKSRKYIETLIKSDG